MSSNRVLFTIEAAVNLPINRSLELPDNGSMSWKVTKMFCEEDSKSSHKASAIANSSQTKTQVSNFQEKLEHL